MSHHDTEPVRYCVDYSWAHIWKSDDPKKTLNDNDTIEHWAKCSALKMTLYFEWPSKTVKFFSTHCLVLRTETMQLHHLQIWSESHTYLLTSTGCCSLISSWWGECLPVHWWCHTVAFFVPKWSNTFDLARLLQWLNYHSLSFLIIQFPFTSHLQGFSREIEIQHTIGRLS